MSDIGDMLEEIIWLLKSEVIITFEEVISRLGCILEEIDEEVPKPADSMLDSIKLLGEVTALLDGNIVEEEYIMLEVDGTKGTLADDDTDDDKEVNDGVNDDVSSTSEDNEDDIW